VSFVGDDPIEVVDYDPTWPAMFVAARVELEQALGPCLVDIEHIGSTAVPGLAAKPVVDILVGLRSLDDSAVVIPALEGLGYEYVAELEDELPDRRYFRRLVDGRRTHQVHAVARSDRTWWNRHVAFRDHLRAQDEDRDAYADLKRRLASEHRHDRVAYTAAKSDFIRARQ